MRLLLAEIAAQGPLSRADLARATALTKQTITNLVDELLLHQLVIETGQIRQGVGKPSTMLLLNGTQLANLAIRIWPQRIELALSSLVGDFIGLLEAPRDPHQPLALQVQQTLTALLAQTTYQIDNLLGAGLTLVQQLDDPLARHQQLTLLAQQLASTLQLPVCADHTAAACAAYQLLHGEARQLQSFCYIHLGQQIDCAVVFERQLFSGRHGLSGALGEIFVTPEQDHRTGDFGRLNDFASVTSLQQFVHRKLPNLTLTDTAAVATLAQHSDKIQPWLDRATEPLRIAIHTLESVFHCQTIIIGGEISAWLLDKLISQLRPLIPSVAQYGERQVPRLIKTPQVERVALQGLAALPLHVALRTTEPLPVQLPLATQLNARQLLLFAPTEPEAD